ncbi:MAG: sigma-70 family RNA polymerase sigma factor [Phycisphaerales bacterium]|nr:sigma-70 family RNA polymerase sigma factor [Phycisphaerales bacterium]
MNSLSVQSQSADDYVLMEAIAAGDPTAMDRLYNKYSGLLLAVCQRIVNNRTDAEEVLLDVFWELWRRASRYEAARGAPVTYLITLTRSRAIDRKRSSKTGSLHQVDIGEMANLNLPANQAADNPGKAVEFAEQGALIRSAMESLPGPQRKALEMAYFDGLSHSEIAAKARLPLGTVKSHIRLGLIHLRDILRKG